MNPELEMGAFFGFAEEVVHIGFDVLSHAVAEGDWMKVDKSYASHTDVAVERSLLALIRENFPGWPIVAEEQYPNLPDGNSMISVDALDGSSNYLAGGHDWSMSVGMILDGKPVGGVVVQPGQKRAFAALKGTGVKYYDFKKLGWHSYKRVPARKPTIVDDKGPNSPFEYLCEIHQLSIRANIKTETYPAVAGGIETLVGRARGEWSYTYHIWDMCGLATIIEEMGGVVECLDYSPISWTSSTALPPVVLAESPEWADTIRRLISSPFEANRPRLASQKS